MWEGAEIPEIKLKVCMKAQRPVCDTKKNGKLVMFTDFLWQLLQVILCQI